MNQVTILRGIPSSGKSTYARELISRSPDDAGIAYISADAYTGYLNENFQYIWTPEACKAAHKWAHALYEEALEANTPLIVVDNTNLKRKRGWGYYVALAIEYGYRVKFVEFVAEPDQLEALAARNLHGLNVAKLQQMLAAWEPIPYGFEVEKRKVTT